MRSISLRSVGKDASIDCSFSIVPTFNRNAVNFELWIDSSFNINLSITLGLHEIEPCCGSVAGIRHSNKEFLSWQQRAILAPRLEPHDVRSRTIVPDAKGECLHAEMIPILWYGR